ncbi:MAG TPA: metallophosphoesterase [Aquabacterium sp.]|uniref:metallophosphoesterase family protein n=1 Tax=Aquabacterium sp. TaxID=1872578 RepID=UPI002E37810D|nr:metallophosphoesterase [Aquabacterium sp.]HEX5357220.1 metallophosphoesterase [Aquabacterium sp.]
MLRLLAAIVQVPLLGLLLALPLVSQGRTSSGHDPVVLRFSTVGDSRQEPDLAATAQDRLWLQNSQAWARILKEMGQARPHLLFFNGDMIMGYGNAGPVSATDVDTVLASGLVRHHVQYAFWRGMVTPLMAQGTYVVPVAGNHEVQCRSSAGTVCTDASGQDLKTRRGGKNAIAANEAAWRANMGDLILDVPRLQAVLPPDQRVHHIDVDDHATLDQLSSPQHQLSYSFDIGQHHFAIINTDPADADSTAPTAWLARDLSAARQRGARHLFVFGHKPAFSYDFAGNQGRANGLDMVPAARDAFWAVIEQHLATYFCGHQHVFNMRQPIKPDGQRSQAWQVILGSGGSPFDVKADAMGRQPFDRFYAWAQVRVHRSGKVGIDVFGFDEDLGRTRRLQSIELRH